MLAFTLNNILDNIPVSVDTGAGGIGHDNPAYNTFSDLEESWLNYFLLQYDSAEDETRKSFVIKLANTIFKGEKYNLVCKILKGEI